MNNLVINFKNVPTKQLLFDFLKTQIIDLYGENYDALIDSLTSYKEPFTIQFENITYYEDKQELIEVFEIIQTQNKNIILI